MADDLSRALTDSVIRRLAGSAVYERGSDYFTQGHVESLDPVPGGLRAIVQGENEYSVTLASDDGVVDYSCSCPAGAKGDFCKHCAAAALAWLHRKTPKAKRKSRTKKRLTLSDAEDVLAAEDRETIVRLVLEWAKDDSRLRDRLLFYAARRTSREAAIDAVKRAFQKAVKSRRKYIDYREAGPWARGIHDVIASMEQLFDDGHAAGLIEIIEAFLDTLTQAFRHVDDSDGHFSSLSNRLEALHLKSCEEARPDPVELARRLFAIELNNGYDVFSDAVSDYSSVLGPEGLSIYRELALAEWKDVPVRTTHMPFGRAEHFQITRIMEALARLSGDVEEIAGVLSRDLSSGHCYDRIKREYAEAGQPQKALLWAEKGLAAFPNGPNSHLLEYVTGEYHSQGRHDEAMSLVWKAFSKKPGLELFPLLERHARLSGAWPHWRERAIAAIRAAIANTVEMRKKEHKPWVNPNFKLRVDPSPLIEVLLYEGRVDDAWQEALAGDCDDTMMLRLADMRVNNHPEDSARLYLAKVDQFLASFSASYFYDQIVDLLIKAGAAMRLSGRADAFRSHLDALREDHKTKKKLIELLDANQKALSAT